MKRSWFQMVYDSARDRWIVDMGVDSYALRCGNFLEIRIGDQGIPCRIELDRDWYVVMQDARFYLHQKEAYQVEI